MGGKGVQDLTSNDVQGLISNALETSLENTWPGRLGLYFPSTQETETYNLVGNVPAMREWIGGRMVKSLRVAGISVTNKTFESTLRLHLKDMRRDKTGFLMMRIGQLAARATTHWASLLSTLIIAGETTACYDDQYFFSASHSFGDSGILSNLLTASDYGELNISSAAKPTAQEMSDAAMAVIQHFMTLKDDQGEPVNEDAREFMLMVPANMYKAARAAIGASIVATGAGFQDNILKVDAGDGLRISVAVNPRLTTTTEFYVFRTDGAEKPFILQEEDGIKQSKKAEGSDFEHDHDMHEYGIKAERNVGPAFWQTAVKATFS